jgi:CheY-like chemotaxis protein
VTVELDVPEDLPLVALDTGQLSQVFLNLVNNAADAMPDGRDLSENIIEVRATEGPGEVQLVVSDNGAGIEPHELENIFDPFFTTRDVGYGTGLGLSICHTIIEQAGGTIAVSSQPGRGTTFTVSLPRAQRVAPPDPAPVEPTSGSLRLLLIDDDPMVLKSTTRLLGLSHDVTSAQSAEQAREILEVCEFDAIICDVMMPKTNGLGFYDWLVDTHPKLSRRFVYFTGGMVGGKISEAVERAGIPVIAKPLDTEELDAALSSMDLLS